MTILHDPNKKVFLTESDDREGFVRQLHGEGVPASVGDIKATYAIKDGFKWRLLKRPRYEYTDLDPKDISSVLVYRY